MVFRKQGDFSLIKSYSMAIFKLGFNLTGMKTFLILTVGLLVSCGPAYHLRKAKKHLGIAESLGARVHADTLYKELMVAVPEIRVDTIVRNVDFYDTIVITKEGIITKIKVDCTQQTAAISTICPERIKYVKVPYTITKSITAPVNIWKYVAIGILGTLLPGLLYIGWRSKERRK